MAVKVIGPKEVAGFIVLITALSCLGGWYLAKKR